MLGASPQGQGQAPIVHTRLGNSPGQGFGGHGGLGWHANVQQTAMLDPDSSHMIPLFAAAEAGTWDPVKAAIVAGCDINAIDRDGQLRRGNRRTPQP